MLRGLATISLYAADLEAATRWYTELLGVAPYFTRPGYSEFRIGDYQHELGVIDRRYAPAGAAGGPAGAVVYWHVDTSFPVRAADQRLTIALIPILGRISAQPPHLPSWAPLPPGTPANG